MAFSILLSSSIGSADTLIRRTAVAGSFYSSDPDVLSKHVDAYLAQAKTSPIHFASSPVLIVPHAGYIYSGQTAAHAYKLVKGLPFDTVILLGASHKVPVDGASIWLSGQWETPLGNVSVDESMARELLALYPGMRGASEAHLEEHSLEVQIPFLQKVLSDFKIVPILVNDGSFISRMKLAQSLVEVSRGKRVLIVASSDMSHYHSDAQARIIDQKTVDLIQKKDTDSLWALGATQDIQMCGMAAVLVALEVGKLKSYGSPTLLHYATSAEASGNRNRVVGYSSWVFAPETTEQKENGLVLARSGDLGPKQQKELLRIARQSIESYLNPEKYVDLRVTDTALNEKRAVFVTLRKKGALRGCVGSMTATEPLYQAVRHMALESASRDPRFLPVEMDELKDLEIEISVISPMLEIQNIEEIRLGKHGVYVAQEKNVGVFLPKVAKETGWTKEQFLSEVCSQKAGLDADCWKNPETKIFIFSTQDFKESLVK